MALEVIGQPVPRIDARGKMEGRAEYTANFELPGMLTARALRSPLPHARVLNVDTSRALRLTGGGPWPLCAVTTGAAISGFAAAVASGEDLVPPLPGQAWMLLLALGPQTAGWLLIGHGVARLRAFAVSLLLTVQPVLTAIWGVLAFGEHMRPLQIVGVALVLGGVLMARPARRLESSPAAVSASRP